jgi:hypothetical protein
MAYLDTSVLVAYLVPETYSAHAETALRDPMNYPPGFERLDRNRAALRAGYQMPNRANQRRA